MRQQPERGYPQGGTSAEQEMISAVVSDTYSGSGVTNIQE